MRKCCQGLRLCISLLALLTFLGGGFLWTTEPTDDFFALSFLFFSLRCWDFEDIRGDLEVCLRFFLFSCKLAWPLSPLSDSEEAEELDDELEELDEPLELSENIPLWTLKSTPSATSQSSGILLLRTWYHLTDKFGLPRTVLCQTMGKFVVEQKFWVTATVVSKFSTTCHHPPGIKTVSPGLCRISIGLYSAGHDSDWVLG